jgi:predicted dehydrogenase
MLKIGVIGAGHLGKIHINLLRESEHFELIGFYDTNTEAASQFSTESGVALFDSAESLMAAAEVVDIVTPTFAHHIYACQALRMRKHVFIEKPIAATVDEAKEIELLADEAGCNVAVGHVERFNPAFQAAMPYLNNPMFIETHRLAQFNPRGTDVSVVLDLMIHDIDIVLKSVGCAVRKISASGVSVVSETPDIANARIEFDNGCVANLTASRLSMKNMRKTRFFQRDAYISVDFLEKETEVIRLQKVEGTPDPLSLTIDLGGERGMKEIFLEKPEILSTNAIKQELESFAQAIVQQTPPVVSASDGVFALDIANRIIEKMNLSPSLLG